MSDFLDNLIQRHAQPKPLLRPRLSSLFETVGVAAATAAPKAVEETPFGELSVETDAPLAQPERRQVEAAPKATARKPIARVETAAEPETALPPARTTPEPIARRPARLREDADGEEAPAFAMPARETPKPFAAQAPAPPEIPHAPPAIELPVETRVVRHVLEETVVREAGSGLMQPPVRKIEQAPASAIRPIPQSPLPEPPRPSPFEVQRAEPAQRTRAEARQQAPDALRTDAEPIIHVSIGRVEIRASEEREARPRKPSASSSVMTLEEYLKSRAKR
jgi:hypothetical protein